MKLRSRTTLAAGVIAVSLSLSVSQNHASAAVLPPLPDPIQQLLSPAPTPTPSQPGSAQSSSSGLAAGGPGACASCSNSSAGQSGAGSSAGTSLAGNTVSGGSATGNQTQSGSLHTQDLNGMGSAGAGGWSATSNTGSQGSSSSGDSSLVFLSVPGSGQFALFESQSQASSTPSSSQSSSESSLLAADLGDGGVTLNVLQAQAAGDGSSGVNLLALGGSDLDGFGLTLSDPAVSIPGVATVTALAHGTSWADGLAVSQILGTNGTLLDLIHVTAQAPAPTTSNGGTTPGGSPSGGVLGLSSGGLTPAVPLTGFLRLWPIWLGILLMLGGTWMARRAYAQA